LKAAQVAVQEKEAQASQVRQQRAAALHKALEQVNREKGRLQKLQDFARLRREKLARRPAHRVALTPAGRHPRSPAA